MLIAVAYTRAPARMKGLVYASLLFSFAGSYIIVLIASPFIVDPNLIWPFVAGVSYGKDRVIPPHADELVLRCHAVGCVLVHLVPVAQRAYQGPALRAHGR